MYTMKAQNTFTDANNDANTLTVACTQTTLTSGTSTQCTATETDTAPTPNNGPPQGTVSWSISPADGTFSPSSCTLGTPSGSSSKCTTTFTASSGGNATITGTYNRSNNNWASNTTGTLLVTVNQAPAITSANSTVFKVATAGTFTVTASGFPASTFTETGLYRVASRSMGLPACSAVPRRRTRAAPIPSPSLLPTA